MFLKCDCKLGPGLKWEVIIYLKKTFVSSPVFKCLGLLGKIKLCSLWGHLKICHNSLVASVWHRHVAAMFQTQARTTTWPVRCLRKWFRFSRWDLHILLNVLLPQTSKAWTVLGDTAKEVPTSYRRKKRGWERAKKWSKPWRKLPTVLQHSPKHQSTRSRFQQAHKETQKNLQNRNKPRPNRHDSRQAHQNRTRSSGVPRRFLKAQFTKTA